MRRTEDPPDTFFTKGTTYTVLTPYEVSREGVAKNLLDFRNDMPLSSLDVLSQEERAIHLKFREYARKIWE